MDAFEDGAFEPVDDQSEHKDASQVLFDFNDVFLDRDFPPLWALPEPHNAICKAIIDMVEEITRLKHLIVTVVFKDDSAWST